MNVMIVEDNVTSSIFIKESIQNFGVSAVASCKDATSLFEQLKTVTPQLILMEINIQGSMDGIQLAKKIYEYHRNIQIIFITAHSDNDLLDEAFSLENTLNYLIKPIGTKELEIALRSAKKHIRNNTFQTIKKDMMEITPELRFDRNAQQLFRYGNRVKLSTKHQILIVFFIENPNSYHGYDDIKRAIWRDESKKNASVRDIIRRVRSVIPELPIESAYGKGYSLNLY